MAKFVKGGPKAQNSGRKKGSRNKRVQILDEILENKGFNSIVEMIGMLKNPDLAEANRARLLCELAQYQYPKRKHIEHSGETRQVVRLIITGA